MNMPKSTWKQRFSYWFDNTLSRGPVVLIGWLAVATILLVLMATILALIFSAQPGGSGLKEVFWDFLFQALTPNPFDVSAPWLFLVIMLVITLASLLIVSILIGILTTSIENRLDALRRGRSKVLENKHTVILGWSHQIFTIVSELVTANENRKEGAVIAILADQDKVIMEDALRGRVPDTKNTRLICRSGKPMDLDDLEIVSPHTARSIIILPPEENDPDSYVIKTILAIVNNPNRRKDPYHIVTQINTKHNLDVIRMFESHDDIHSLLVGDQISRIVAQTSRQSGLSVVYTELLNFEGDELYFQAEPKLAGRTYAEALLAYEDSAVVGLRLSDGTILLNPAAGRAITSGDQVIAISADDDMVRLSNLPSLPVTPAAIKQVLNQSPQVPERGLILGWNSKAPLIIQELDSYVAPGSELLVVASEVSLQTVSQTDGVYKNLQVTFRSGDVSDRQLLNRLNISSFLHVIVLSYEDLDVQAADAETMVTLLHLRDILGSEECTCAIVSEMLDLRNRRLAEVARVDDFIVSDHLISLMLAQVSENSELYHVFLDLFDPIGSEIYFKPVTDYVDISQPLSFYTLVEAASRRGETAIGYRKLCELEQAEKYYGVHTNPKKSERISFSNDDKLIVLAERQ
jgi:voltage-gated potassium channel Kch